MKKASFLTIPLRALVLLFALSPVAAWADSAENFYAGKRIAFLQAGSPGGGFELYARVLAEYMPKHLPGNPLIVVQSMVGAGGAASANYMYNVAAQDGTAISMPLSSVVVAQLLQPDQIKYVSSKFGWIGTMASVSDMIAVWHTAGVNTLEDAKKKEVIFGTSAINSMGYQEPALANALLGTKFKIVLGYNGQEPTLAMERGEIQSRANQWESWRLQSLPWLEKGTIIPILQFGPPDPEYPNVPVMMDLVKTDEDRALVELLDLTLDIGRSVYTTPGVPSERVALLRAAFDATMADPVFQAEMEKRNLELSPRKGAEVQAYVDKSQELDSSVIARFNKLTGGL